MNFAGNHWVGTFQNLARGWRENKLFESGVAGRLDRVVAFKY